MMEEGGQCPPYSSLSVNRNGETESERIGEGIFKSLISRFPNFCFPTGSLVDVPTCCPRCASAPARCCRPPHVRPSRTPPQTPTAYAGRTRPCDRWCAVPDSGQWVSLDPGTDSR